MIYDRDRNTSVAIPDAQVETGRREIPIKTGISNGVKTEVTEGSQQGQKVILR